MKCASASAVMFLTMMFLGAPVWADTDDDGNQLLRACKQALKDIPVPPTNSEEAASLTLGTWCRGFLTGLVDMNSLYQGMLLGETHGFFCFPKAGLDSDQATRIVVKYLESNPEQLHNSRRTLAVKALAAVFPCEKSQP